MKKALWKDSIKEIKNTYKRFLSILLMAFLGVGFFAGMRAVSPDMVDTIDHFYDSQHVYDIQVMSTLGLTDEDIDALGKIEGVETVIGTYEVDGKIEIEGQEIIAKVLCIEEQNTPILIEGRFPENQDECVVEESFLSANQKAIGDTITLEIEKQTNDQGEEIEYLNQKEMKIVGTVQSPVYISRDRGTSTLGAGKINYYLYIEKENVLANEIYTSAYITLKGAEELTTSSKKYEDYVEEVKTSIETIKEEREKARYTELVDIATQKVTEAEAEFQKEKEDANSKIAEAEQELENARTQIQEAEETINANTKKANTEFTNAEKQIQAAKEELTKQEQELASKEEEANKTFEGLEKQKEELQENLQQITSGLFTLEENYQTITESLKDTSLSEEEKNNLEQQQSLLKEEIDKTKNSKQIVENGIAEIEQGIESGKQEIEGAKSQIQTAKEELAKQEETYTKQKQSTYAQIEQAKTTLQNSKEELEEGEAELEKNKQELNQQLEEAEGKLTDARQKINDIENPKWYILDRYGNARI